MSEDLMHALFYDGDGRNTVVEVIKVDRENETVCDDVMALEAGLTGRLGSPAEILYKKGPDGKISVTFFPYSNCYYTSFVINGKECMWDEEYI